LVSKKTVSALASWTRPLPIPGFPLAEQYTPRQLELILHEPQPRVSELLNDKLGQKSLEKLLV
jgi:hypothetical protein